MILATVVHMARLLFWLAASTTLYAQQNLNLVGAATRLGDRVRLTPAAVQTAGAAWLPEKQDVAAGFETSFQFQLTGRGGLGGGADGFAFVLQNSGPLAIAGRGGAGGFALGDGYGNPDIPGIPNSIAVFFDTYRNPDARDPSNNYIAICTNRTLRDMRWPPSRLAYTRKLPFRLNDGNTHSVRVHYQPPLMRIYLDGGEPVLSVPVDLSTVLDERGRTYAGFTASTGSGYENHDIMEWTFASVDSTISSVDSDIVFLDKVTCLEGRNLCTPKDAVVEEIAPGEYHVILPAHREWAASIANAMGAEIEITNARGHVCWDTATAGKELCGGPNGVDVPMSGTLVSPDRKPGALAVRNDRGRTWFTVNDRSGAFSDNQGFFEFDVRLK
jgi:hypothetical protein